MIQLRDDAEAIWRAGVEAVGSERLVRGVVERIEQTLRICGREFPIASLGRIAVVGAGKAGAGMAAALEDAVGPKLLDKVFGWVNVPADCVRELERIHLHAARPAGVNEPTSDGVHGADEILQIVSDLEPDDLCVILLSGGGSALLPAPAERVSLEEKQVVTRFLMRAGATINELNCVRKQLSRIKGGNLGRACRAGNTVTLIISDVIGDPLDVIASGPTVPDHSTPAEALAVLENYRRDPADVPNAVIDYLSAAGEQTTSRKPIPESLTNHVIGNNAMALSAAAQRAEALGYRVHHLGPGNSGVARDIGARLAVMAQRIRDQGDPLRPPACLLWGGESIVHLTRTDQPRRGGRNQEVVLAGLQSLREDGIGHIVLLSGGTDGEDGPTDAAGAVADADVHRAAVEQRLEPADFLAINNSYAFFEQTGGLLKTGPTHTNVMDVAVVLVAEA